MQVGQLASLKNVHVENATIRFYKNLTMCLTDVETKMKNPQKINPAGHRNTE